MSEHPNGISIGLAVLAEIARVPNTHTHAHTHTQTTLRATSVAIGRIVVLCMRCGLETYLRSDWVFDADNRNTC